MSAGGPGGSSPEARGPRWQRSPPRELQLPALRGAARRRPRRRERLPREPSSPSGRSMNGSVAGSGYTEEIISLTRRPSGKAGAASPRRGRGASRAGAAAPRPEQPPRRPERKRGAALAGTGAALAGTGAATGGSRRRGSIEAQRPEVPARRPPRGSSRGGYAAAGKARALREGERAGSESVLLGAPVETGVPADNSPLVSPLVFPGSCCLRGSCCFQVRRLSAQPRWIPGVRGHLKIMCPSGRPLYCQLGVHCAAYLERLCGGERGA